jgi:hypothetical protein
LFEFRNVGPVVIIRDELVPCSERPDPDWDTYTVETSMERSQHARESLIMVPSGSIRFIGERWRFGRP